MLPEVYTRFKDTMDDDLDTPKALAVFFEWMKSFNAKMDNIGIAIFNEINISIIK